MPAVTPAPRFSLVRLLPVVVVLAGIVLFFASGAKKYVSIDFLRENYQSFRSFVDAHFFEALAIYAGAYILSTAFSLPGGAFFSLTGGFLFGLTVGTAAIVVSATIGATLIFLAARTALGDVLRSRAGGFIERFDEGFERDGFFYMLLLRVVPIFPFFIVNLAPAFTRIKTSSFVLATLIGIIPGSFAYASVGNGLGAVFASGGEVSLSGLLLRPEVLTPIVALSVLAIIPIVYRRLRGRNSPKPARSASQ